MVLSPAWFPLFYFPMRIFGLVSLLLVSALLLPASAQSDSSEPKNIPEAYRKLFQKAVVAYEQQNFDEAIAFLDQAEEIYPNYSETYNLKGGIYTQQRKFDEAQKFFEKALELNDKSYPVRFNLAEISFLEKDYAKARDAFAALEQSIENDDEVQPQAVGNLLALIEYKIYLTYLLQDNMEKAKEMQDSFSFTDNTPNYYFANAAIAFHEGDKAEAQNWLRSADRIYPPQLNRLYADSFFEIGWIDKPTMPTGQKSDQASE